MLEIALHRLHAKAKLPWRTTSGSFGYDLCNASDEFLLPGATKHVDTGWNLANPLPPGVALMILPRSSLWPKFGLQVPNAPGLIDADYTGPIKIQLWLPPEHEALHIPAGTRLAQAVFVSVVTPTIIEADYEQRDERGGFGFTGSN